MQRLIMTNRKMRRNNKLHEEEMQSFCDSKTYCGIQSLKKGFG